MAQELATALSGERSTSDQPKLRHRIALPERSHNLDHGVEWMVVESENGWQEIKFTDYSAIYDIPGLYEQLFHEVLECDSPRLMCQFLQRALAADGGHSDRLRVLDLGAGNGMMGAEVRRLGVGLVVGVDLLDAAAAATERDHPGCYDAYHVTDLARLTPLEHRQLRDYRFNALTCVAALGLDDARRSECFHTAFNLIGNGGWVAITIKEPLDSDDDGTGFAGLIRDAVRGGALQIVRSEVYRHRLTTSGEPLHYTGILARKCAPLMVRPRPPMD
jgi:hypothetical protein